VNVKDSRAGSIENTFSTNNSTHYTTQTCSL